MIKHAARIGIGNSVGKIFLWFGCITIAAVTSVGTYIFLANYTDSINYDVEISSPYAPTGMTALISALIGYAFLNIFAFSSDAILASFVLDEELGFRGGNRPDYMEEFA